MRQRCGGTIPQNRTRGVNSATGLNARRDDLDRLDADVTELFLVADNLAGNIDPVSLGKPVGYPVALQLEELRIIAALGDEHRAGDGVLGIAQSGGKRNVLLERIRKRWLDPYDTT